MRDQIAKLETLTQKEVLDKQASRNISFCFLALSWLGQTRREERRGEERGEKKEKKKKEERKKNKEIKVWNFSMELCKECMDTCLEV